MNLPEGYLLQVLDDSCSLLGLRSAQKYENDLAPAKRSTVQSLLFAERLVNCYHFYS